MTLSVLAVFDRKTASFDNPFTLLHPGEGIRQFEHLMKDTNTKFGKNPEDFVLMKIGEFDISLGTFQNVSPHINLAGGIQDGGSRKTNKVRNKN